MNDVKAEAWITVIGIGCDGLDGLSAEALGVLQKADVLGASARYHTMIDDPVLQNGCVRLISQQGFTSLAEQFQRYTDRRIVVLSAGDPMHYGAGSALARRMGTADLAVIPKPSAFSLACARMVWSVPDSEILTIHANHASRFNLHVTPGAKIVALGQDGLSPAKVARYLCERGFYESLMSVFCDMGAEQEQRIEAMAKDWPRERVSDLNTICVECVAGADARWWSRVPGLPGDAFIHGEPGLPREIRSAVLALLAPQPAEYLWAIGDGCGGVAIEWLRSTAHTRAVMVADDAAHGRAMENNAEFLGVPQLHVSNAADFADRKTPDAIFLGGQSVRQDHLKSYFERLNPGGRLIAVGGDDLPTSLGGTRLEMRVAGQEMSLSSFLKP